MEIKSININLMPSNSSYALRKNPVVQDKGTAVPKKNSGVNAKEGPENAQPPQANSLTEIQKTPESSSYKAFFAIDDNDNVVIRIVDEKGEVIKQIPPEEYMKMADVMREYTENLLHMEV